MRRTLGDEPRTPLPFPVPQVKDSCRPLQPQPVQQISGSTGRRSNSALRWRLPCSGSSWAAVSDAQIVNVALPVIGAAFGAGLSDLQWVVAGYTLPLSSLLLFAGTLSDRVGARRIYGVGMAIFIAASALGGLAPSSVVLIAARVAQGVGAALITPTSLALIREAFDDARQRVKAIAYWALGGSVAAAAGPLLGGLDPSCTGGSSSVINLPIGLLAIALLARVAPSPRRKHGFDIVGQISALVALVGFTYAVIEGGDHSYSDPQVILAFVLSSLWRRRLPALSRQGKAPHGAARSPPAAPGSCLPGR